MAARYYSRSLDKSLNSKKENKELKKWVTPTILAVAASAAAAAEMCGMGLTVVAIPAVVFMVMLIGALAPREILSAVMVYTVLTPILTGMTLSQSPVGVGITAFCLLTAAIICIAYRPFLWKNGAASAVLAVFIIFLNLAVTNAVYTVTLVVTLLIKSAVTWVLCMGVIQGARKLLLNGRFLQWVLKQD